MIEAAQLEHLFVCLFVCLLIGHHCNFIVLVKKHSLISVIGFLSKPK